MKFLIISFLILTFFKLSAQVYVGGSVNGKLTQFANYTDFPSDIGYSIDIDVVYEKNDILFETGVVYNFQKARSVCIKSSSIMNVCERSIREKIYTIGVPILASPNFFHTWEVRPSFGVLLEYMFGSNPSNSLKNYRKLNPYIQMNWKYIMINKEKTEVNLLLKFEHSFLNLTKGGVYNVNKRAGLGIQVMFK